MKVSRSMREEKRNQDPVLLSEIPKEEEEYSKADRREEISGEQGHQKGNVSKPETREVRLEKTVPGCHWKACEHLAVNMFIPSQDSSSSLTATVQDGGPQVRHRWWRGRRSQLGCVE